MWYVADLREAEEHPRVTRVAVPGKEYRPFSLWPQATVTAAWTVPIQQVPIFSSSDFSREAVSPEHFPKSNKAFT